MDKANHNRSVVAMIFASVMWSTGGILVKLVPWHPLAIGGPRGIVAALVLLAFIKTRGFSIVVNRASLANGFCLGMVSITFLSANKLTTAANAVMLQYVSPVFVLLISIFFLHRTCQKADVVTVALTLAGISLFFMDQLSPGNMLGNFIALTGGLFLALTFVISGEVDEQTRLSGILFAQIFTAVIGIPFAVLTETPVSPTVALTILALGTIQMGIPYALMSVALKHCTALTCNLIGVLEPLLNPLWVFLFYGEQPGLYALLGGLLVITVITVWCAKFQQPKTDEATEPASSE